MTKRTDRLNSLLRQVISEVVKKEVRNPHVSTLLTITRVDITRDLHRAKVYVSVIGSKEDRKKTVDALQKASGFISSMASKKVAMRYFPYLKFIPDATVDQQMRIAFLLEKIDKEKQSRYS